MIVWLNGPFGVGKTTVARLLQATIVDPERLGFVLRRTVGLRRGDYQDLRLWRRGTRWLVERAAQRATVVVPMSVLHPPYLAQLLPPGSRHILLDASPACVRARIDADTADPAARGWRLAQLERYEAARAGLALVPGTVIIPTDARTPAEVATAVRVALVSDDRA